MNNDNVMRLDRQGQPIHCWTVSPLSSPSFTACSLLRYVTKTRHMLSHCMYRIIMYMVYNLLSVLPRDSLLNLEKTRQCWVERERKRERAPLGSGLEPVVRQLLDIEVFLSPITLLSEPRLECITIRTFLTTK